MRKDQTLSRAQATSRLSGQAGGRTLGRIRTLCLSLPETSERLSHGAPAFFVRGKRAFVMYMDNHHGDGRRAIWCAAPEGMQGMLVKAAPRYYFVPPYVGYLGWVGLRLDRAVAWDEIADTIEDAYLTVAPKKVIKAGPSRRGPGRRRRSHAEVQS